MADGASERMRLRQSSSGVVGAVCRGPALKDRRVHSLYSTMNMGPGTLLDKSVVGFQDWRSVLGMQYNVIVHLTVPTPTPNHGVQTTLALSDSCADASRRVWPRGPDTQACRRASLTPLVCVDG